MDLLRAALATLLALALPGAAGCSAGDRVRLIASPEPRAVALASRIASVLERGGFEIEVVRGAGADHDLARLRESGAELAIVENSVAWTEDVRALLPLYTSVLHILHRKGEAPTDLRELITGKRVFAGAEGGMARHLLLSIARARGIGPDHFTWTSDGTPGVADVMVVFAPPSPELAQQVASHYRLFTVDDPELVGRGALIEGVTLLYPQLEPFVIPRRTYDAANPDPVVTLGVTSLLVGGAHLDRELAHDLVAYLVRHKSELAHEEPSLFHGIRDDFDPDTLNFPLHPGARDFVDRDHPGFFERYAELGGVTLSLTIAITSGLIAVGRRRDYVKKQRIDQYYEAVLRIQAESVSLEHTGQLVDAIDRIRGLQREAFDALIDEQVAADESFRIFIRLANDTVIELEREIATREDAPPRTDA